MDKLDPPMTKKERALIRQIRGAMSIVVGGFQFSDDPGARAVAMEEMAIFDESATRLIQAYRDAKG